MSHAHGPGIPVFVVARAPRLATAHQRDRQVVHARGGRESRPAVLGAEGGEIHDRFEGRARLATGERRAVELTGEVVTPADQGTHFAGLRLDRDHQDLQPPRRITAAQAREAGLEPVETTHCRGLGEPLQAQVERDHDADPTHAGDLGAEALLELLAYVVDEVRRHLSRAGQRPHADGRAPSAIVLGLGDHPELAHAGQHRIAAVAGPDGIDRRRVDVRAADDRGDQCRLAGRDLMNLLAEIRTRRGPDPAHRDRAALSEVDLVQVRLEDALLGVSRLDQRRQPCLPHLPEHRPVGTEQPHLDELLRDGAPAFFDSASAQVGPGRAHQRADVETPVLEEPMVLGRQHGVDQDPRRLLEPDRPVVFSRPVHRAREHLGLQGDAGDILAIARDPHDPVVEHLKPNELGVAAEPLGSSQEQLPGSRNMSELTG